jgi:hypothetical protein
MPDFASGEASYTAPSAFWRALRVLTGNHVTDSFLDVARASCCRTGARL